MDKSADTSQESNNKWLRPKEIKIGPLLPASIEGHKRFDSRKGFKPTKKIPQNFHTSTIKTPLFSSSPTEMSNINVKTNTKTGGRRALPSQTILSETQIDSGPSIWGSSVRGNRGGNKNIVESPSHPDPKGMRNLYPRNKQDDSKQSLLIEGNSVWSGDIAFASHALDHLSECVQQERRLREQLDLAKYAKLQAFRSITNIFRNYVQNPSIRTLPEAKTIARCSVVTKTLATIIQTFLRYFQSKQLVAGMMRNLQRRNVFGSDGFDRTVISVLSERAQSLSSDYDRASRSVEDLLDEQEISKLKQLYFDYYDCEVVSIGSQEFSDASGMDANNVMGSVSSSQVPDSFRTDSSI